MWLLLQEIPGTWCAQCLGVARAPWQSWLASCLVGSLFSSTSAKTVEEDAEKNLRKTYFVDLKWRKETMPQQKHVEFMCDYVDPCSALPLGFCCFAGFFHLKRCSLHEVGHPGCQMMQSCGGKSHCSPSFSWCLGGEVVKISQGDWEVQKLTNHWCGINHGRIGCRWQSWILLFPVLSRSLSLTHISGLVYANSLIPWEPWPHRIRDSRHQNNRIYGARVACRAFKGSTVNTN